MRTGYKTADFHRCKTDKDRLYYSAAIPSNFWEAPNFDNVRFKTFALQNEAPVVARTQKEWFDRLIAGEFFSLPYLIMLTADVDDNRSTGIGFDVMKVALERHNERIHVTEASNYYAEKNDVPKHDEQVRMLINVYDDSPNERIQIARDWAHSNDACFRLLCTAGDPGALIKRLRLKFHAVFYIESKVVTEKVLA